MRIGVDLGGTKIAAVAFSSDGAELARRRTPTPHGDYDGTVRAIAQVVAALESDSGQTGTVGVGIPGAESLVSGLIKNANSVCLIGQPLAADLATALDRPVRLANDANCFALSEASDGAGRRGCVRRYSRHRRWRRRGRRRQGACRRQRYRRRVGA